MLDESPEIKITGNNTCDRVEKFPASMARYLANIRTFQKVSICERNRNPGFVPFFTDQTFALTTHKKDGQIWNFSGGRQFHLPKHFLLFFPLPQGQGSLSSNSRFVFLFLVGF